MFYQLDSNNAYLSSMMSNEYEIFLYIALEIIQKYLSGKLENRLVSGAPHHWHYLILAVWIIKIIDEVTVLLDIWRFFEYLIWFEYLIRFRWIWIKRPIFWAGNTNEFKKHSNEFIINFSSRNSLCVEIQCVSEFTVQILLTYVKNHFTSTFRTITQWLWPRGAPWI